MSHTSHRRLPFLLLVATTLAAADCRAQDTGKGEPTGQAGARFELAGEALTDVAATIDYYGLLRVTGHTQAGAEHAVTIAFPEQFFPAPGEHPLGEHDISLRLDDALQAGKLQVRAFGFTRVDCSGRITAGKAAATLDFALDCAPELAPVRIAGALPIPLFAPPADKPNGDDIVFCALGNTGTGLPGQRRVGKAIANLAATGPLDFVLLLGDNFLPRGIKDVNDPLWQTCFSEPYPDYELPMPFYAVCGKHDLLGNFGAEFERSKIDSRWTMDGFVYSFDVQSHGKKVLFIGLDTQRFCGQLGDPAVRFTKRVLRQCLQIQADWKIVFGYDPIWSGGPANDGATAKEMRNLVEPFFVREGVDLYIAAGDHHMEYVQKPHMLTEVVSGCGGGREIAHSAMWGEDTLFAATGEGFAWFRFDGLQFEISFRDSSGKVLFAHRIRKK
jgi:Calcineurin-like phosphoesterase